VAAAGDTSNAVVLADTVGKRVWGDHLAAISSLTASHPGMRLYAAHPVSMLQGIDGFSIPKSGRCWQCGKVRKQAEFRIVGKVNWGAGFCYSFEWRCSACARRFGASCMRGARGRQLPGPADITISSALASSVPARSSSSSFACRSAAAIPPRERCAEMIGAENGLQHKYRLH
jgi:hypothetical protein